MHHHTMTHSKQTHPEGLAGIFAGELRHKKPKGLAQRAEPITDHRAQIFRCPASAYEKHLRTLSGLICRDVTPGLVKHAERLFSVPYANKELNAYLFSALANPTTTDDCLVLKTVRSLSQTQDEYLLLHALPTFRVRSNPANGKTMVQVFAGWHVQGHTLTPIYLSRSGFKKIANEDLQTAQNLWHERRIIPTLQELGTLIQETDGFNSKEDSLISIVGPSGWSFFAHVPGGRLFNLDAS